MRNTEESELDADQPIAKGSSLTISVYYTSLSALETDATIPVSPEPAVMSNSMYVGMGEAVAAQKRRHNSWQHSLMGA
jgi:hypothetical protein